MNTILYNRKLIPRDTLLKNQMGTRTSAINRKLIPRGKKGSHTGMIISFVVFITSLIVIFSLVDIPSDDSFIKKNSIDVLKSNFIEEVSADVIIVRTNDDSLVDCASFSTPTNTFTDLKLIAADSGDSEIQSAEDGGTTFIENGDNLTKIYYMDGGAFSNTLADSSTAGCTPIEIKNIEYSNKVFEKLIIDIINETNYSYATVKSNLEVSGSDEFKIQFIYSDDTKIGEFIIDDIKTDIYVTEYNINYISLTGIEKNGVIKIGLW